VSPSRAWPVGPLQRRSEGTLGAVRRRMDTLRTARVTSPALSAGPVAITVATGRTARSSGDASYWRVKPNSVPLEDRDVDQVDDLTRGKATIGSTGFARLRQS